MSKKRDVPAPMPKRKELSDTPVKLCNEISRLFRAAMRENDNHDGVMSQHGAHLVLSTLAVYDGINQLELVRGTHLSPPTISVILKRMESEGIVERKSDPNDMRSIRVYLTDEGRRLDKENIENVKKLDAIALMGLTGEEIDTLMTLLPRIRDNMLKVRNKEKEETEQ